MLLIADYFYYDVLNDYPEFGGWHQAISAKYTHGYLNYVEICHNHSIILFKLWFSADAILFCGYHINRRAGPAIYWTHLGALINLSVMKFNTVKMRLWQIHNGYDVKYFVRHDLFYRCDYVSRNRSIIRGGLYNTIL